jgi:SagB-type dehydrogenase family enzyme
MPSEKTKQLIENGRAFLRFEYAGIDEPTDQQAKLPQPPLVKANMTKTQLNLPTNFSDLPLKTNLLEIINQRESRRSFTDQPMTMLELSFLLWTTQGIKNVRGANYATLRTVPCGGARHEFETYLALRKIEGVRMGVYHYLPMTHQIEFLTEITNFEEQITGALEGQKWAASANVVFIWSVIPYRSEWRYSFFAHRIMLVDIGYVSQNLYIACEAIGLGTCAIGAFTRRSCDMLLGLDGNEEFAILASPVGTLPPSDLTKEPDYFAFLHQQRK